MIRSLLALAVTILVFAIAFHLVMGLEGRRYPWWVGVYWTVSTMTTLGLGDIVFTSPLGEALTAIVVLSGVLFMLVLLPLVLIQFPPWIEARRAEHLPHRLRADVQGHVLITRYDPVAAELIRKLEPYGYGYAVIVSDPDHALNLHDLGVHVMLGETDHPDSWRNARLEQAALVVATDTDKRNPNAVFTARSVAADVPILASSRRPEVADLLELAGCTHVLPLSEILGRGLARRAIGSDAEAHEIGSFGELVIAEASATQTPLVGKALADVHLEKVANLTIVGVWERGEFEVARPDTTIGPHTTLVLAGTRKELLEFDVAFSIYHVSKDPVVVIGGGTVGRAVADSLRGRGVQYRIVDRHAHVLKDEHGVQGDAIDLEVLERAGIAKAPAVVITTHDDDTNILLALYCRRLRSDVQIVSRANLEKNVETLHRAGTDSVMSLTSLGANAIFNVLERGEVMTVSEGVNMFKRPVPDKLAGRPLTESSLRETLGCTVVALIEGEDVRIDLDPHEPLSETAFLVLIGTREAERRFVERFGG